MKGYKKLLFGEKMPDKNDPAYAERYRKEVEAGRKFAKKIRFDKAAAGVQRFAIAHRKAFIISVFSFIVLCLSLNIYRMVLVFNDEGQKNSATERQEEMLRKRHKVIADRLSYKTKKSKTYSHENTTEN